MDIRQVMKENHLKQQGKQNGGVGCGTGILDGTTPSMLPHDTTTLPTSDKHSTGSTKSNNNNIHKIQEIDEIASPKENDEPEIIKKVKLQEAEVKPTNLGDAIAAGGEQQWGSMKWQ